MKWRLMEANAGKRVSMGLSVWHETSKKLTACRELFCPDNRVVCSFS